MLLNATQLAAVNSAAAAFADDAAEQPLDEFMGATLGFGMVETAKLIPDPDPAGIGSINIGQFTQARDLILRDQGEVPSYVVYKRPGAKQHFVAGIATYLRDVRRGEHGEPPFIDRLKSRQRIRTALRKLEKGHDLELVAAAIFEEACAYGQATAGSGDQGVDAIAWKELMSIEDVFMDGLAGNDIVRAGNRVYFVASSKAMVDTAGVAPLKLISPAHIRELVGSWLIQRSSSGAWANLGLQMLTPLQLVLVTTYRLSAESQQDCNKLGVQVWGLPELTYLICKHGPDAIFSGAGNAFAPRNFKIWWQAKQGSRLARTDAQRIAP